MNSLNYLLQTNLYLILFIGFYTLVLKNETFFKQNRIFLNGSVVMSFLIPFINSDWFRELFITKKVREATELIPIIYDPVVVQVTDTSRHWTTTEVILWIYLSGVALFITRFTIQLLRLNYKLRENKGSAFSFFKRLVVDPNLPGKDTIISHEKVHVRQWHSFDVILIELTAIINWFNPIVYLYKKEIKHIHEFIADEEAAGNTASKSDYALLLLSNTLGVTPHQLTNSFFDQSLLKRRIFMLSKNRSRRIGLIKYGLSAPLFVLMLIFSAATVVPDQTGLAAEPGKIANVLIGNSTVQDEPDGYKSFLERHPEVKELAWKINPYRVTVYLKNGKTESYNMESPVEKTNAAKKYGKFPYPPPPPPAPPVAKQAEIPLPAPPRTPPPPPKPAETDKSVDGYPKDFNPPAQDEIKDFSSVQILPEFPGGEKGFGAFLSQNIQYPSEARKNNITGRVFVEFIVEKDGSLSDLKILRGLGYGTDEEAIRVLRKSPRWKPGMTIHKEPVRVKYVIPIQFQLAKKDDSRTFQPSKLPDALYLIDGKESQMSDILSLNNASITSVNVLKGETATEKYGKKGSNGVVEISTNINRP